MPQPWMRFGIAEGASKAGSRALSKLIGASGGSLLAVTVATLISGVVQLFGGWIFSRRSGQRLTVDVKQLFGAISFGVVATAMGVLGTFAFTDPEADVGVTTFIVLMSIVPGALVDWIFFGHALRFRQWFGIALFLLAGWAMLNFPQLSALVQLPAWVLWTLPLPFLAVVNEVITQAQARYQVRQLDPLVNNFWVGLTTIVAAVAVIVAVGSTMEIQSYSVGYWIGSLLRGVLALGLVTFKLLAYQGGGTIALKKFVMQASYLMLAMLMGTVFFNEAVTIGKICGVALFAVGFVLMDEDSWKSLTKRWRN